jgi:hypothetical protein
MDNLRPRYDKIAASLTKLYQDELRRLGLVNTGKLLNSIRWYVVTTPDGYILRMESLDYFEFLDAKYKITENIQRSSQYNQIIDEITIIITDGIISDLEIK